MGFLKYWHISLFFIASTAFASNNVTRAGRSFGFIEDAYDSIDDAVSSVTEDAVDLFEGFSDWTLQLFNEIFTPDPDVNVKFYVAQNKGKNATLCQISANSGNGCKHDFIANNKLTILVHGFLSSHETDWITKMKPWLTRYRNRTVIVINWRINRCLGGVAPVQNTPLYGCAFENIGRVINRSAKFLEYLSARVVAMKKPGSQPWTGLHIVGHSMGAHISGKVAEILKTKGINVNRITGLDPALPCFKEYGLLLDKSQADFVDVIHTNSGPGDDSTLGLYRNLGHVDIYPNYGNDQPDCPDGRGLNSLLTCNSLYNVGLGLLDNYAGMICNHGKATEYMTLSISNLSCDYRAIPWNDIPKLRTQTVDQICRNSACVKMGFKAKKLSYGAAYYIDMSRMSRDCRTVY